MAFTGVAALITAVGEGAAVTVPMVLSAVAEVGTAMTVVGAVTGSKDLMKVGGVMGAVGGIGSLVAGAASGSGSLMSSAVDSSPSAAVGVDAADVGAAPAEINPTDMRLAAGTQGSPMAQDLGAESAGMIGSARMDPADMSAGAASVGAPDPFGTPSAGAGLPPINSTSLSSSPVAPVTADGGVTTTPSAASTPGATAAPTSPMTPAGTPMPVGTQAPQDAASYWNKVMHFMQDPKNRSLIQMGEKLAGGALQGMQQEKQFQQRVGLEQQRINQTSYGSQVATNARRGIVNGAR